MTLLNRLGSAGLGLIEIGSRAGLLIAPVMLRLALALPFLRSGLTKWEGFGSLSPAAVYLFEHEFKLHVFGRIYDFPAALTAAHVAAVAEIILPVLLLIGLATRLAAFVLLIMTGVIQLVMPDGWMNFHLPWAAMALAIMALGPGGISIDELLLRVPRPPTTARESR
jgi:putative oxidoreductase